MKRILFLLSTILFLFSCQSDSTESATNQWEVSESISLPGVSPIGIAKMGKHLWISDGDNNRMVHLTIAGKFLDFFDDFERPMHIDADANQVYIPEYGSDQIVGFSPGKRLPIALKDSLDAPAAISVLGNEKAIADFYNHRILYFNGTDWINFGMEGKKEGEFYHPTDVQITADEIYVADAYNNRVQVFDKTGKFLQMIGVAEKMNAATGLYITENEVMVTDFEKNRILIYDLSGNLLQIVNEGMSKPTDLLVVDNKLYVTNYKGHNLTVLTKK